jgi:hypothetical protein
MRASFNALWASSTGRPARATVSVSDLTVPTRTTAGYGYGRDGWPECAFIRQVVGEATFH